MRRTALLALAGMAAALGFAQPASAQGYHDQRGYHDEYDSARRSCEQERNGRTAAGAVIGAVLGGVVGNNVAHDQSDGSVIGAVVGGVAGAAIGRGRNNCEGYRREAQGDEYYDEDQYAQAPVYDDGDYDDQGLRGGDDPRFEPRSVRGEQCQWGDMSYYDRRGRREYSERVWMCMGRDGVWRPQD